MQLPKTTSNCQRMNFLFQYYCIGYIESAKGSSPLLLTSLYSTDNCLAKSLFKKVLMLFNNNSPLL